mmetsp:Transcript_74810/g.146357  ORF Transcript_74810/g.146357 Transcript_74810/m.146357 type:complete len:226 (-) Transcript_74810:101-778(-)
MSLSTNAAIYNRMLEMRARNGGMDPTPTVDLVTSLVGSRKDCLMLTRNNHPDRFNDASGSASSAAGLCISSLLVQTGILCAAVHNHFKQGTVDAYHEQVRNAPTDATSTFSADRTTAATQEESVTKSSLKKDRKKALSELRLWISGDLPTPPERQHRWRGSPAIPNIVALSLQVSTFCCLHTVDPDRQLPSSHRDLMMRWHTLPKLQRFCHVETLLGHTPFYSEF